MYNDKVPIINQDLIANIPHYMIPVDCCQKNKPVFNFTDDYIKFRINAFSNNKMDALYLTESMQTYRLKMLDELRDEVHRPYSGDFSF